MKRREIVSDEESSEDLYLAILRNPEIGSDLSDFLEIATEGYTNWMDLRREIILIDALLLKTLREHGGDWSQLNTRYALNLIEAKRKLVETTAKVWEMPTLDLEAVQAFLEEIYGTIVSIVGEENREFIATQLEKALGGPMESGDVENNGRFMAADKPFPGPRKTDPEVTDKIRDIRTRISEHRRDHGGREG